MKAEQLLCVHLFFLFVVILGCAKNLVALGLQCLYYKSKVTGVVGCEDPVYAIVKIVYQFLFSAAPSVVQQSPCGAVL